MARGIRGATVVAEDTPEQVVAASRELLQAMVTALEVRVEQIASVTFTVTPDITGEYPARAARDVGWTQGARSGASEPAVPTGSARCIRVLMHVNSDQPLQFLKHTYLREARTWRTDR